MRRMKHHYDKHQEQLPYHAYRDQRMGIEEFLDETMLSEELLNTLSEEELQDFYGKTFENVQTIFKFINTF